MAAGTFAAGVGSLKPTFGPFRLTIVIEAFAEAGAAVASLRGLEALSLPRLLRGHLPEIGLPALRPERLGDRSLGVTRPRSER